MALGISVITSLILGHAYLLVYIQSRNLSMTFRKNNQLGAKKFLNRPLGKQNLFIRVYEGQKEALKNVPDWQERLRECIDKLIEDSKVDGD